MLRTVLRSITVLTLLLYLSIAAQAAIIRVPQDQSSFGAAMNVAVDGDTIELADGTYDAYMYDFYNKAVNIRSASGNPSACIIAGANHFYLEIGDSPTRNVTISGITFAGNSGLGISNYHSEGGNVTISHCVFDDASSTNRGLLIDNPNGTLTITNSTFKNYGAGGHSKGPVACQARTVYVSDCTFTNNRGGLSSLIISGMSFDPDTQFRASIIRCTFEDSFTESAPLAIMGSYATEITDCRFANNEATQGGAISLLTDVWYTPGSLAIHNSTFVNNTAQQGGALELRGGTATIANSTFIGNRALWGGGAIVAHNSPMTIATSTFANNQAENGGAIYSGNSLSLSNSILWGNTATVSEPNIYQADLSIPAVLRHNLIQDYPGLTSTPDANGNFTADPLFVRNPLTNGPDDMGDLLLLPTSPAINTGNNALLPPDTHDLDNDGDTTEPLPLDLGLNPRISTNTVDLGAFEYQNQAPVANGQNRTTNQDTPLGITLTASDTDGESLTYTTGQPSHGTLSGTAPNLTYTPNGGYVGNDSFTFRVADPYGISSNTATISITVKDTTAPVITLNGANPMSVNQGSTFTDPGATATDNVDGPVPVTVSGSVNINAPGSYTLTYSARDAAGNTASKTRTVNVVAVATPKLTVTALGIARIGPLVGVVVRVTNTGTTTATNIRVTGATLIGEDAFLIVPGDSFRLNPGKSQEVLLTFYPLRKGQQGILSVRGTSSGGAFGLNQAVTIP